MENTSKTLKTFIKVLDMARFILLTTFSILFAIAGLGALASGFNLLGIIGCGLFSFCSWTCWSIRRD